MRIYVTLLILVVTFKAVRSLQIRIGAWNLENFGVTKMGKDWYMNGLAKVLATYDVAFLQEIEMSNLDQREELINELQELLQGERRVELWGSGDEHYGLVYNQDLVQVKAEEDSEKNVPTPYGDTVKFSRPPLVAAIESTGQEHKPLWLIGIHTKPSNAYTEIANLKAVYDWYNLTGDDVVILGDLNYGYVSQKAKADLEEIFIDFEDVTGSTDTSTRKKNSPHDRILVTNTMFGNSEIRAVNGGVFKFDEDPNFQGLALNTVLDANGQLDTSRLLDGNGQLDTERLLHTASLLVEDAKHLLVKISACAYSDHYPVEVEITLKPLPSKLVI